MTGRGAIGCRRAAASSCHTSICVRRSSVFVVGAGRPASGIHGSSPWDSGAGAGATYTGGGTIYTGGGGMGAVSEGWGIGIGRNQSGTPVGGTGTSGTQG